MLGMGGGTRERGRPRARWLDDITAVTNCIVTELCGSTSDRNGRRKKTRLVTRSWMRLNGTR